MQTGAVSIQKAIAFADHCLNQAPDLWFFSTSDDPLKLNLPPLIDASTGITPSASALRAAAVLYLQAELEHTYIVTITEALVQERNSITLTNMAAARKLEQYAEQSREWYTQSDRQQIYARVFGIAPSISRVAGSTVNRDFQQRLANYCNAIVRYGRDYRFGQTPDAAREAFLRIAARNLLINLGSRLFGNTLLAARKLQAQLQLSIQILSDTHIKALFHVHTMWGLIRDLLGDNAPDLGRYIDRGQSGMRIINWLAENLEAIKRNGQPPPLIPSGSMLFAWAETWLQANGLEQ